MTLFTGTRIRNLLAIVCVVRDRWRNEEVWSSNDDALCIKPRMASPAASRMWYVGIVEAW